MKAVGVFGGTFDPVHNGHLITARAVLEIRKLDKVIFIPANISPHKTGQESSASEHRLAMLRTAVKGISQFEVSDYELINGGVSYSVDTLRELKKHYNNLEMIIGYDQFLLFNTWKDPEEILKLALPVVLRRNMNTLEKKGYYLDKAVLLDTPLIEISATEIRRRVGQDLPINFLVPEKVMEYIYSFNLYKRNK
jgi:nicotinate-nucleotide adenylyltransferase